jgi:hypothetical protein
MSIQIEVGDSQTYVVNAYKNGVEIPAPSGTAYSYAATSTTGSIGDVSADPNAPNQCIESNVVEGGVGTITVTITLPDGKVFTPSTDEIDIIPAQPDSFTIAPVIASTTASVEGA